MAPGRAGVSHAALAAPRERARAAGGGVPGGLVHAGAGGHLAAGERGAAGARLDWGCLEKEP